MIAHQYRVHIERKDVDQNMDRLYVLSIGETLFGQICIVRPWGTRGRIV